MEIDLDQEALAGIVGEGLPLAPEAAFTLFLDSAKMHREAALERGFSPEAAEQMAVTLHSGLVALYFTSVDQ